MTSTPDSHISLDVDDDLEITADRDQLQIATAELLANALEHGESPIRITSARTSESVEVRVIDSGAGVDTILLDALLYEQEYELRENAADGSYGFGLLATRRAVEAMGGTLRYERVDEQTQFVVSFPLEASVSQHADEFPKAA